MSAPAPKTFVCLYCEKDHNDEKQLVEHLDISSYSNCSIVNDFLAKQRAAAAAVEEAEKAAAAAAAANPVEEKLEDHSLFEDHPLFGLQPVPLTRQKAICHHIYSEKAKDGSDCYYYYHNNGDFDDDSGPKLWYCRDCHVTFPIKAMMEIHMEKKIISTGISKCSNLRFM